MNTSAGDFLGGFRMHGVRPALVFDGGLRFSYAELDQLVRRLQAQLDPDWRLVAIEMAPALHPVAALIACLRAGLAVALLPAKPDHELESMRRRFRPDAIFVREDDRWRLREERDRCPLPVHSDLALLLVTSGSTGEGKGVRLSRAALAANASQIGTSLGLETSDRAMLTLPLSYAYGLSVLLSHLHAGASIYFPSRAILDEGFEEAMALAEPTNIPGVPFTFELLERMGLDRRLPSSLRFATVAGGRMEPEQALAWRDILLARGGRFLAMYGASEATARMSAVDLVAFPNCGQTIGLPMPGGSFEIVDDQGKPVREAGVHGELCYRGPNLMMGYARERHDLIAGQEIDRLMTGDIAFRRQDGLYQLVGRKSRFSKIAGVRIGHDALEAALARKRLPGVVAGDDRALVVFHESGEPETYLRAMAALTGLGCSRLHARRIDAIPRRANGKVDYAALTVPAPAQSRAPADVAAVFADSFYPQAIAPDDSFAALAGDSLKHVEISLGLERTLKHIPDGWERMTVRDLSQLAPRAEANNRGLSSELVIRAMAILLVTIQHATLWPVPGGAAAMTVLLGFAMARFQLPLLVQGQFGAFFRPLPRVLAPYYLLLAGYALAWGTVPWASVFLLGNAGFADPAKHTMLPYLYWYVEAFTQILLVVAGLFLVPAARRLARSRPFVLALAVLVVALALRFLVPLFFDIGNRKLFTLYWILPLVAFGWAAAVASTPRERMAIAVLSVVVMPLLALQGGNWVGSWVKYELQTGVLLLLLYRPSIPVPSLLRSPILVIAHASFHIYLLHRLVPEVLLLPLQARLPESAFIALSIAGGIALGIVSARLQILLIGAMRRSGESQRRATMSLDLRMPSR